MKNQNIDNSADAENKSRTVLTRVILIMNIVISDNKNEGHNNDTCETTQTIAIKNLEIAVQVTNILIRKSSHKSDNRNINKSSTSAKNRITSGNASANNGENV